MGNLYIITIIICSNEYYSLKLIVGKPIERKLSLVDERIIYLSTVKTSLNMRLIILSYVKP